MRSASITFKIIPGILIVAATAWLLLWISQTQLTRHLRDQAASGLSLATSNRSSHQWRFHSPRDIVAGKVFGAKGFKFHDQQLDVRSSGEPFQIGLPLSAPLDLVHFSRLDVVLETELKTHLRVLIRQRLNQPQYTSQIVSTRTDRHTLAVNLDRLRWRVEQNDTSMPDKAAMLRLEIDAQAGDIVSLYAAGLSRREAGQLLDLDQPMRILRPGSQIPSGVLGIYRLPETHVDEALRAIASTSRDQQIPVVVLPQTGRIEQQLILRDHIRTALPDTIIIPASALASTIKQARSKLPVSTSHGPIWRWAGLSIWLACMFWIRLRPPGNTRLRALLELALVLGGILWLIVGARFKGHIGPFQGTLIAATLVFALALRPVRSWHWNGSAGTWLLAFAVVIVAATIGVLFHPDGTALRQISETHVLRYLFWALLQQYLICTVCTERWRIITGSSMAAIYLGALGFALLHTPNSALMLTTLTGGLCWCALYLRERALLPIAVSHAASAILLLTLLPRELLYSAEVSARFLQ